MTMQADEMAAINDYFNRTAGKTLAAKDAKASWSSWYNKLSFVSKSFSGDSLAQAIKRRIAFNAANGEVARESDGGLTEEEKKYFANMPSVDITGLTPTAAKAKIAAANANVKVSPPASLLAIQYGSLRQGSKGDAVKKWQSIIGVKEDGIYGPATAAATKKWQAEHAIKADGVVGPATWTAALGTSGKAKDAVTSLLVPIISQPAPASTATQQNFDLNNAVAATGNQIQSPPQKPAAKPAAKPVAVASKPAAGAKPAAAAKPVTAATAAAATGAALHNAQIQTASFLGAGWTKIPPAIKWATGTIALGSLLGAIWYNRKAPKPRASF